MTTPVVTGPDGTQVAGGSAASSTTDGWLRRRIIPVVGAAVLLIAGFGAGWLLRGGDGASAPSYVVGGAVVVGDELTDRQLEMVDVTQQYVTAFMAKDGDAVASFMVPDGHIALPTLTDQVVRADDGTLQDWVEGLGMIPNELSDPIVVRDNYVVLTGRLDAPSLDWMIMIRFTESGEVKIVSDTHWTS
jgi:hypothetical protein